MDCKVPSLQHLEPRCLKCIVNCLPFVDFEQAASQLDFGLDLEVQGVLGIEPIGHAVLVSAKARTGLQQTKDFAVDAELVRRTAGSLY